MTWAQTGAGAVATIRGGGARSSSAGLETKESDSMADLVGIQTSGANPVPAVASFFLASGQQKHFVSLQSLTRDHLQFRAGPGLPGDKACADGGYL